MVELLTGTENRMEKAHECIDYCKILASPLNSYGNGWDFGCLNACWYVGEQLRLCEVRGALGGGNGTSVICQLWASFVSANFLKLKPMWFVLSCWNRIKCRSVILEDFDASKWFALCHSLIYSINRRCFLEKTMLHHFEKF